MTTVSLSESSKTPTSISVFSSTSNDLGGAVTTSVYLGTSTSGTFLGSYGTAARVSTTTPRVSSSTFSATGLSPSTSYSFYAQTTGNVSGNVVATGSTSITTPSAAEISVSEISKTFNSAQIQVNSTNNLGGTMTATLYRGSDSVVVGSYDVPANSSLNTAFTDTGLSSSTTYTYYAKIIGKSSGTLYATSSSINVTTNAPPSPPTVSSYPSLSGTGVTGTSLTATSGTYTGGTLSSTRIAYATSANTSTWINGSNTAPSFTKTSPYTITDLDAAYNPYLFATVDQVSANGQSYYYYSGLITSQLLVSFTVNGGTAVSAIPYVSNPVTPNSITLPYTSKADYTFNGWYLESGFTNLAGLTGQPYSSYTPPTTGSVTLYAKWTPLPPSKNYGPSISGTGISGDVLTASKGSYDHATNSVSIAYSSNGIFSGNMPDNPSQYTVTDSDASYPPYYFAAKDTIYGTDGSTTYEYSGTTANTTIVSKLKVTFNSGGGTSVDPLSYIAGSTVITLPYTSRDHYDFNGWYTAATGGTRVGGAYDQPSPALSTSTSTTLYAQWTAKTPTAYSYPQVSGTGTAGESISFSGGSYSDSLSKTTALAVNTTGTFSGSEATKSGSSTYTVTTSDATYPPYYFAAQDEVLDYDGNPYYFYSQNSIKSNFKITYDHNHDGVQTSDIFYSASATLGSNNPITLPTPLYSGYMLLGWFTDPTDENTQVSDPYVPPNDNVTLYAHWEMVTYTLNFNANGGSVNISSKPAIYGEAYGDLPTPSRSGYNFSGWYTASSGGSLVVSTDIYNLSSDSTIYARWTAATYTLTFDPNGGTVDQTTKSVTYASPYGTLLAPPDVSRTGYSFNGWFTATSGGTQVLATDAYNIAGSSTIFAQWTASIPAFSDQDITTTAILNKDVNTNIDHTVSASPVTSYSIIYSGTGLDPTSWLSITKESGSDNGILSGKPTQVGAYTFIVRAANNGGGDKDSSLITMIVYPAGKRRDSSSMTALTVAKRFDGTSWINMKVMRRFDGTAWQDIGNI